MSNDPTQAVRPRQAMQSALRGVIIRAANA